MTEGASPPEKARYTTASLAGKHGHLWAWGDVVREGGVGSERDERDSFAALGMVPMKHKLVHSPLPATPAVLDCGRAFAHLATLPGQARAGGTKWTLPQLVILLYYAAGLGWRLPTFNNGAHPGQQAHHARLAARQGINGQTGDPAVAHVLRHLPEVGRSVNPEGYIHGKRHWAIGRMCHYLNTTPRERGEG